MISQSSKFNIIQCVYIILFKLLLAHVNLLISKFSIYLCVRTLCKFFSLLFRKNTSSIFALNKIKFIGQAKVSDIDGTIRLVTMDKFNVPVEIEVPAMTETE